MLHATCDVAEKNQVKEMPGRFVNVECFAGRSEIAKAFKRGGYPAAALDVKLNPDDDPCLQIQCCSAFGLREFLSSTAGHQ